MERRNTARMPLNADVAGRLPHRCRVRCEQAALGSGPHLLPSARHISYRASSTDPSGAPLMACIGPLLKSRWKGSWARVQHHPAAKIARQRERDPRDWRIIQPHANHRWDRFSVLWGRLANHRSSERLAKIHPAADENLSKIGEVFFLLCQ